MRRTHSPPTHGRRWGDPATRRPGDPATRRPGDPATRRPGDPATRRPGDPATRRPGDPATRRPGLIILSGHSAAVVNPQRDIDMTPGLVPTPRTEVVTSVQTLCNRSVMAISDSPVRRVRRTRTSAPSPLSASRINTGIAHPAKDPVRPCAHRTDHPGARSTHGTGRRVRPIFRRTCRAPPGAGAVHAELGRSERVLAGRRTRRCMKGPSRSCTHTDRCGGAFGVLGTGGTSARVRSVVGPMRSPAALAWAVPAGVCALPKDARRGPHRRHERGLRAQRCQASPVRSASRVRTEPGVRMVGAPGDGAERAAPCEGSRAGAMRSARCSADAGSGAARRGCRLSLPRPANGCGLVRKG